MTISIETRLFILLFCILKVFALLIFQASFAAPYTIENTYNKLKPVYPHLGLPRAIEASPLEQYDLIYKQITESKLMLDVYRFPSTSSQPLLVLIHGGGWASGSKDMLAPLARAVAKQGFVVASINYRLSGAARFPAGFEDARDAVIWLKQNAAKFQIDSERVALAGGSAGGQLAALLAYSGGKLDNEQKARPFVVQALINLDGLSDFTSPEALPYENDPKKNPSAAGAWFGGRYEEVPELWRRASPYYYINELSPPTLFINSGQSRFHAGRNASINALTALKINSTTIVFADAPHAFWHFEPWFSPTVEALVNFLRNEFSPH